MRISSLMALFVLFPGSALAGTTVGVSYSPLILSDQSVGGGGVFGTTVLGTADPTQMPTIDVRFDQATLQIHALDLLSNLIDGDVLLGVDGYYHVLANEMPGKGKIVAQPGIQLDIGSFDPSGFYLGLAAAVRCGVEVGPERSGFGVYAIPDLGVVLPADNADAESVVGGALGFSIWY